MLVTIGKWSSISILSLPSRPLGVLHLPCPVCWLYVNGKIYFYQSLLSNLFWEVLANMFKYNWLLLPVSVNIMWAPVKMVKLKTQMTNHCSYQVFTIIQVTMPLTCLHSLLTYCHRCVQLHECTSWSGIFCSTSLLLFLRPADLTMGTAAAAQVAAPCWGAPMVNVVCVSSMAWSRMAAANRKHKPSLAAPSSGSPGFRVHGAELREVTGAAIRTGAQTAEWLSSKGLRAPFQRKDRRHISLQWFSYNVD